MASTEPLVQHLGAQRHQDPLDEGQLSRLGTDERLRFFAAFFGRKLGEKKHFSVG